LGRKSKGTPEKKKIRRPSPENVILVALMPLFFLTDEEKKKGG